MQPVSSATDLPVSPYDGFSAGPGYLPSYAARSDQGCVTFPVRCTKALNKKPTEYLRQFYYDSMVFTPGGVAPPDCGGRREPDCNGDGLPVSLDQDGGRPHSHDAWVKRCRARRDT